MDIFTFILALAALGTSLACIGIVFLWGRRIQSDAYRRPSLVSAAEEQEIRTNMLDLNAKAMSGPLDPENNPFPEGAEEFGPRGLLMEKTMASMYEEEFRAPYGADKKDVEEARKKWEKDREEREARRAKYEIWHQNEKGIFEKMKKKIAADAHVSADKRVPASMDVSVLGGGFSFLLEFSTVIVIIFAVVIMGILATLEGKEIATILAAIAGYVLGKATGFIPSLKEQPKTEEQTKKIEEQSKTIEDLNKKIEDQSKKTSDQNKAIEDLTKKIKELGQNQSPG